jgi:hypothetical protein
MEYLKEIATVVIALIIGKYIGDLLFNHIDEHGPDSNVVKKNIYKNSLGTCYVMEPIAHICPLYSRGN